MSNRVIIDDNRITHVNGKPFFLIGARHIPLGATPALLKEIGFNAMRWVVFGMNSAPTSKADLPKDMGGLMFYPYIWNRGDFSEDAEARKKALAELVLEVRDHPSLLCYEQRNEPAYTFRDQARPQSPPEGLIAGSRVIRELDPNHPIRVGHVNHNLVSTLRRYNPAVDIVGCNPYVLMAPGMRPFVGCRSDGLIVDSPNQTLSAVGDLTTKMMRVAEGRPVWMQIQAAANENWFNENHTPENKNTGIYEYQRLYPAYWQMRFMSFNAIIRGATGLEWMLIKYPVDIPSWQDVCRIIGELRSLHDVLCAQAWTDNLQIEYVEMGFSDWTGVETLVKLHEGKIWILAANTQFDPMTAVFSNLPRQAGKKLKVFGKDREISIQNGAFSDRFQPYEVHIYTG